MRATYTKILVGGAWVLTGAMSMGLIGCSSGSKSEDAGGAPPSASPAQTVARQAVHHKTAPSAQAQAMDNMGIEEYMSVLKQNRPELSDAERRTMAERWYKMKRPNG